MSKTFEWCKDKTRLGVLDKHIFCIDRYGTKAWYLNGELHRVNGPAVEWARGDKYWYLNDKLHREDGPAIEHVAVYSDAHPDDGKWWYLNGKYYTETDFWSELKK